ncbi:MAG: 50S ribosomal protein L9 [Desulfobaccales bacterium]|nr:50S ribosomal protein L9 [Desulfobaccales bacterium]
MKVILTEDVTALGAVGTVVEVARGYARNFLIPQGKALEATAGNLARVESLRVKQAQVQDLEQQAAMSLASRLEGVTLTIPQRVGEGERLYGSVTAAMIAEALATRGFAVDRKQLELPGAIKRLGVYEITVRLGSAVKAQIKVEVIPENV